MAYKSKKPVTTESKQNISNFSYTAVQQKAVKLAASDATDIMLFGGSRSGKTFCFTCLICTIAMYCPGIRIAIIRRNLKDVRESVFMDSFPKAMKLKFNWDGRTLNKYVNKSDLLFAHPNGSEIWFSGLEDKDRVDKILGKEFGLIYFNEVSQLSYSSVEVAKTRLAQKIPNWKNKCFYDCNPPSKSHWAYKLFVQKLNPTSNAPLINPDDFVCMKMNPDDNRDNISSDYLDKQLASLSGKNRQRFLLGEWTDDAENALWKQEEMINRYRVIDVPPDLDRVVVGVDPAVTSLESSDYTGIVVCGKKWDKKEKRFHFYVMADRSLKGTPNEWATAVFKAYKDFSADRVVAEVNQGGDLVKNTILNVYHEMPVTTVRASRGKIVRAEPIAALYEQGIVHHVGLFPELESEMCSFTGPTSDSSPDRMDALVWAMTNLSGASISRVSNFTMI